MALTKMLFGAWTVSVGASECANATLWQIPVGLVEDGCFPTDVAVDSSGNVWITSSCSTWMCPSYGDDFGECWSVKTDFDLKFAATGIAIAVDDSGIQGGNTTLYISQNDGVMKCTAWNTQHHLDCLPFGEDWDEPHRLDLDHEGNLLVTNAQGYHPSDAAPVKTHGVWRCSPRADCVLVGGSDDWLDQRGVAADSKGTVYMSGNDRGSLEKCTSAGACKEFGAQMGAIGQGVAVGPDDYVYMTDADTHSFTRCSPNEVCEKFAPDGFPDGPMAIDPYGAVYTVTPSFSDSPFSELHLIRSCFDSPAALLV